MFIAIVHLQREFINAAESVLEPLASGISSFENGKAWRIDAYLEKLPDRKILAADLKKAGCAYDSLQVERLPKINWVAENQKSFTPIRVGRYFIHDQNHRAIPPSAIPLEINAATAFGTGHHATTQGCLAALDHLAKYIRPTRVLDMGCGTAILAMAAAKTWGREVVASDIDLNSVEVSRTNVKANRVNVRLIHGDGYKNRDIAGQFDLIFANILAKPLTRMAKDLRRHLSPGGYAILSGLLIPQENEVLAAHRLQDLCLVRRYTREGWRTLVLRG
ncbi:MAG: 50S ribosomal protein L11 methyltransferase [Dongiaceae bacterium]